MRGAFIGAGDSTEGSVSAKRSVSMEKEGRLITLVDAVGVAIGVGINVCVGGFVRTKGDPASFGGGE